MEQVPIKVAEFVAVVPSPPLAAGDSSVLVSDVESIPVEIPAKLVEIPAKLVKIPIKKVAAKATPVKAVATTKTIDINTGPTPVKNAVSSKLPHSFSQGTWLTKVPKPPIKIVLSMIVHNEGSILERCFKSVQDIISYYVINANGCTDNTVDVIEKFWGDRGIKGEILYDPWVSFDHNRTIALQGCEKKGDYALFLDADEVFIFGKYFKWPENMNAIAYMLRSRLGDDPGYPTTEYSRMQMVRLDREWRWKGVLHEVPMCIVEGKSGYIKREVDGKNIPKWDDWCAPPNLVMKHMYNWPRPDGARSSDPNKYLKDSLCLWRYHADNPNDLREIFYLARSLKVAREPEIAARFFKLYIAKRPKDWFPEECYEALRELAECTYQYKTFADGIQFSLAAYEHRPHRIESLWLYGRLTREAAKLPLACLSILEPLLGKPVPDTESLFLDPSVWQWRVEFECAMASVDAEQWDKAEKYCTSLIKNTDVPPAERLRIQRLMTEARAKSKATAEVKASDLAAKLRAKRRLKSSARKRKDTPIV